MIVTVFSYSNVLQARKGAFEVGFAAQSILFGGTLGIGSDVEVLVSDLDGLEELFVASWAHDVEIEAVLAVGGVASALEAGIMEETVGMAFIAEGDLVRDPPAHGLGWRVCQYC